MDEKQLTKAEQSKRSLMEATLRLAGANGYQNTSIRDICAEAGLSIGAFYYHYESKDDLLNESFLFFDRTIDAESENRYEQMPAVQAVKAVLIDQTAFTEKIGARLMREYYRALLQGEDIKAIAGGRLYYKTVKKFVEKCQREGFVKKDYSAAYISDFLIKSVRGCVVDWCLHDGEYNLTKRTEQEVEYFILPFLG